MESHDLEIIQIWYRIRLEPITEDEQSGKPVVWDRSNNMVASSSLSRDVEIDLY